MNDHKMPVILIGNSFKYEIESTLKIFFHTDRFSFSDNISDAVGDSFVVAGCDGARIYTDVKLSGVISSDEKILKDPDNTAELELCRLIYRILSKRTGIIPPWGLMTGIRPVKKVTELIKQGKNKAEIFTILKEKYEISQSRLELAWETAVNQLPLLQNMDSSTVSLYVSIPFCPSRCSYCSFVSHSVESAVKLMPEYVEALCRELKIISGLVKDSGVKIDTIYFGGGTPTSLSADDLRIIMECVAENFDLDSVREYCVEAGRPDTITREKLHVIKELGVQRISVNPQTLNDDVLKVIRRKHSAEDAVRSYRLAREIGFRTINTDLILGLPSDTLESFELTLKQIVDLAPENITIHTLTVKRGASSSEGSLSLARNASDLPYMELLRQNGYLPYYLYRQKNTLDNLENVGYSFKGHECLYNIFIMDESQTILGAGCAASTKLVYPDGRSTRIHNYKYPYEYIRSFDTLMEKKKEISQCLKKIR